MRAWAAVGAFLVLANTAAAEQPTDSEVPPLATGESAPADVPNYFDRRELGAGTLVLLAACQETATSTNPDLDEATRDSYCECVADTARSNVRSARTATPTTSQDLRCAETARNRTASPFVRQFATPTASIAGIFDACLADPADGATAIYHAFVCGCATNAWITDRLRPNKLDEDIARCAVAGRYREDTGQNPTFRQFAAIRLAPSRVHSGSGATPSRPMPGEFIPYPGTPVAAGLALIMEASAAAATGAASLGRARSSARRMVTQRRCMTYRLRRAMGRYGALCQPRTMGWSQRVRISADDGMGL